IRLTAWVLSDSVAQAATFTIGLFPVATWGGTSPQNPFPATVSTAIVSAAIVAPGAGGPPTKQNSNTVNFPAAGYFLLGCIVSNAAVTTNGPVQIGTRLSV